MAGVDGDHEVALAIAACDFDGLRGLGQRWQPARRRLPMAEVDDQPMAVGLVRRRQERLRFDPCIDVEYDAQARTAARAEPDCFHDAGAVRNLDRRRVGLDAVEIDDDAVWAGERENRIGGRRGEVEHDAG